MAWITKKNGRVLTDEELSLPENRGVGFDPSAGYAPMTTPPWDPRSTETVLGREVQTRGEWEDLKRARGLVELSPRDVRNELGKDRRPPLPFFKEAVREVQSAARTMEIR